MTNLGHRTRFRAIVINVMGLSRQVDDGRGGGGGGNEEASDKWIMAMWQLMDILSRLLNKKLAHSVARS